MPTSTGLYDTSTILYDQSSLSYDGYPAPLSNMPAVGVYVAFTDGPYVAEPVWTDVSYLTRDVSIRRGRQDDLQQFPSGQCSITFDNRDRYFDPFNTASPAPFNGNLKPRRQVKVVAVWNGVSYPLFRGFVAGWPVEYTEAGLDSTVTVDCFDLLGLMAQETLDANPLFDYIQSLSPVFFVPFNSWTTISETTSGGAVTTRYIQTKNYGTDALLYTNNYTASATTSTGYIWGRERPTAYSPPEVITQIDSIIPSQNLRTISKTSAYIGLDPSYNPVPYTTQSQNNSICFWLEFNGNSSSDLFSFATIISAALGIRQFSASLTAAGVLQIGFGSSISQATYDFRDNQPHFIVATSDTTGTTNIFVDGVNMTTTVAVSATNSMGRTLGASYFTGTTSQPHSLQHFAYFNDRVLTQAEISAMYNLGLPGRRESASTRLNTYFTQTGIPSALISVEPQVDVTVDELPRIGTFLLPEVQRIAASEAGEVFADCSGVVQVFGSQYWSRRTLSNTSQVTFTDTGTGVKYDNTPIRMRYDADQMRNKFVFNISFGGSVESTDSTSSTQYAVSAELRDTRIAFVPDAQTIADEQVAIYKNPKLALDPFVAKGQQSPSYNWPLLLGLELLERVTFKRTPAVGSAVQRDLLVQAIEHRITPGTWETVVNGSTRYTGWFIIGTSLLGSSEDVLL